MSDKKSSTLQSPKAGAWASYRYGWRTLKQYFLELLVVVVLFCLAAIPLGYPIGSSWVGGTDFFILLYLFLFFMPLQYGVAFVFLKAIRGEDPKIGDMMIFLNNYFSVVTAHLLVAAFMGIGFILLIVPGFVIMCKLAFVPYLVTYEQLDTFESLRMSWRLTRNHAWKIFRIWLLALPIYLGGLMVFGVGILVSTIWVSLAYAALYYKVSEDSELLQTRASYRQHYASRHREQSETRSPGREKGLPNLLDRDS